MASVAWRDWLAADIHPAVMAQPSRYAEKGTSQVDCDLRGDLLHRSVRLLH
jgi:hypothetical protein